MRNLWWWKLDEFSLIETLVLIAGYDEVITRIHSQRLIDEFPVEQITVKIIADSRHNDISEKAEYYQHLKDYFNN